MDTRDIGEFCKSAVKALKENGVVALLGEEYFVNNYGNAMIDALHKRDVDKIVQLVNECVFEYNIIQANKKLSEWECEKAVESSSSLYCEEIEKCQIDSLKQIFSKIGTQIDDVDKLVKENYKKEHPSENKAALSENEGYQDEDTEDDEEEPYFDTDEEKEEDSLDEEEEDYDDEELEGFDDIDDEDEEYYSDAKEDGEYDQYGEELANVVSFEDDGEEYDDSSDEEDSLYWEEEDYEEPEDTDDEEETEDEEDLYWEYEDEEEIEADEEETGDTLDWEEEDYEEYDDTEDEEEVDIEDALDWEEEDEEEVTIDERKPSRLIGMTDIVEDNTKHIGFDNYFREPRVFDKDKAQDTLVSIDKATRGISKIFDRIVQGINE